MREKALSTLKGSTYKLSPQAVAARAEVINVVNNFFHEKLNGVPSIKAYIDSFQN